MTQQEIKTMHKDEPEKYAAWLKQVRDEEKQRKLQEKALRSEINGLFAKLR